jgi:hypothetical protein
MQPFFCYCRKVGKELNILCDICTLNKSAQRTFVFLKGLHIHYFRIFLWVFASFQFRLPLTESWDSSVGIVTGWTAGIRFPAGARFFSSPYRPDRLWGPSSVLSNGYRVFFPPEVKRQGRKTDHHLHPVPRSRMVDLYLHSPTVFMAQCLINSTGTTLPLPTPYR